MKGDIAMRRCFWIPLFLILGAALIMASGCARHHPAPPPEGDVEHEPGYPPPLPPEQEVGPEPGHHDISEMDAEDRELLALVKGAIRREPGLDDDRVYVRVMERIVYLSGRLDSERQRDRALEAARSVEGVRHVNGEELHIRP